MIPQSTTEQIKKAVTILKRGGVIAYPTEAVYGLGCDPCNEHAVMRLLTIKKRAVSKGLILIAADWKQLKPLVKASAIEKLNESQRMNAILATWPGAVTWVFPASENVPAWIHGQYNTVAIRVTEHPIANAMCTAWQVPLVSTSANVEGQTPAKNSEEVKAIFDGQIDYILPGKVGGLSKPTQIRDALTGKVLRY